MNYIDVYNKITLNREDLPKETYGEVHHIWPRSLGGGSDAENLVRLTAKEHYIAHHLLSKIFLDCREMIIAFNLMCGTIGAKGVYVGPKIYAEARENAAKAQSELMRGKPKSAEHRAAMSKAKRGASHSDATRAKMSAAKRGEKNYWYGRHHSAESLEKNRESQLGSNNSRYDLTQYIFQHPEHGERICTQYELRTECGLNKSHLSNLVQGKRKSHKGWRCLGEVERP